MPYYLFAVKPMAQLELLAEFDAFAPASAQAKAVRAAQRPGDPMRVKVMFAATRLEAEDLILQVRDPGPLGDD